MSKPAYLYINGFCEGLRELARRKRTLYKEYQSLNGLPIDESYSCEYFYNSVKLLLIKNDSSTEAVFMSFMTAYNMPLVMMFIRDESLSNAGWGDMLIEDFNKTLH